MALSSLRLRLTLRAISALHRSFSATSAPPYSVPMHRAVSSAPQSPNLLVQSRAFRSSSISLLSARSSSTNIPDEIGPDTILFEGCDYNHWLFVMDFPKDNKPSPEQMIEVYEQTCAKGLNISLEEAKKKIYACSTTTYTGFQAVMTEEESKKFEGLPGVIFVLPDSYIDPVNKEYGGDKYINGTIIPRPPPIQYGRSQGRRDRNRNPGQYNRQENPMSNPQGNLSYNNWGSMQGDGRNYGASQNYPPQQNYGQVSQNYPPQQNYGQASQNYPPQQNYGQASQNYPRQQNYGQASQNYPPQQYYGQASQNYPQQQTYGSASQQRYGPASPQYAPQRSFGPPGQGERRNNVPTRGGNGASQVQRDAFVPSYMKEFEEAGSPQNVPQQNFGPPGQGERRNPAPINGGSGASEAREETFTPSYVKDFKPSYMEDFKPSYMEEFEQAGQGNYFAKEQAGSQQRYRPPGQGNFTVDNRNDDSAQNGNYGQGVGYQGQGSRSVYRDGQRLTQGEQRNEQGEQ